MTKVWKKCPCCGSLKIKKIYDSMRDKNYFVEGEFPFFRCQKCRMEFPNPTLNEKELAKYYPATDYYSYKNDNPLALKYHDISAYYYSKRNPLMTALLWPFKTLLYTYYNSPADRGKTVLEIGCGDGLKLKIYQKYGIKTYGLEPYGPKLTKEQKKLGISRQTIGAARYKKNSFDYIILKESLEHIPDQKQILKKCFEWLKPGGKVIITVQNTNSLWRMIFKEDWFGYDVPRHVYNYNTDNISYTLRKYGFEAIKARAYDNPYMLAGSLRTRRFSKYGKKSPTIIYSDFSKILFTPISLIVSYIGLGSLMEIECIKPVKAVI